MLRRIRSDLDNGVAAPPPQGKCGRSLIHAGTSFRSCRFDRSGASCGWPTGATSTYSPTTALTNRFTVGYDYSQQEGRNLRNFGYEQFPQGGLTNDTWSKRILTFDYVGTYSFGLISN